jgi:hypothetical protein
MGAANKNTSPRSQKFRFSRSKYMGVCVCKLMITYLDAFNNFSYEARRGQKLARSRPITLTM